MELGRLIFIHFGRFSLNFGWFWLNLDRHWLNLNVTIEFGQVLLEFGQVTNDLGRFFFRGSLHLWIAGLKSKAAFVYLGSFCE